MLRDRPSIIPILQMGNGGTGKSAQVLKVT